MRQITKEKLHMLLSFLVFYLLVEIIMFAWMDFSFLPTDFLIDFILAFAVGSVIFLIRSTKVSIIYLGIVFGFVIALFLINATMYSVYYDIFTLQQFQLINEAKNVFSFEHLSIFSIIVGIVISALYAVYMFYIGKIYIKLKVKPKKYWLNGMLYFCASMILVFTYLLVDSTKIDSFVTDSNVTAYKRASFEKYGILGYYAKEVEDLLVASDIVEVNDTIIEAKLSTPTDYFGLLQGKNVVNILLESVQPFAINEVLTPNMYRLTNEGLYFENSYSENKTNVSELIAIIGNNPSVYLSTRFDEYDFSYSLPLILKENEGYITSFFHDNVPEFYSRDFLMPQIGFEHNYFHDDLFPDVEIWNWNGNYTPDSETMSKMLPNLSSTDSPFYSYWATMSTHGPYNYGLENIELYNELGYFDAIDKAEEDGLWTNILDGKAEEDVLRIRHYQATVMELDKAIGMMLDDLEAKGVLEDTIIVLFGDHNVYYHKIHLKIFEDTNNNFYNMDMYKNFFCIYNETLTSEYLLRSGAEDTTISEFVSPYVIAPTLLDLLGYQYNESLFLGTSVFDDYEDVFYSLKLTGIFNENLFSSDGESILYYKNDYLTLELEDFQTKSALIKDKIKYINNWYIESKTEKNQIE
ncbi:MAG: sulfatase-like hydrolase/transferase [Tenericutes bacterium]|nr:sulfatase-like hydrolase/transferase [Mycoplasmatota bacterium]